MTPETGSDMHIYVDQYIYADVWISLPMSLWFHQQYLTKQQQQTDLLAQDVPG
jgi:hypothetical protein